MFQQRSNNLILNKAFCCVPVNIALQLILKQLKKMNSIKTIAIAAIGMMVLATTSFAQNYKAPKIDASGKVTDGNGVVIGTMTKEGVMNDAMGMKMAHLDAEGNLVDTKTGKKMGKAEKNGDFMYMFSETNDGKKFTIGAPSSGICEVKDDKGNVVLLVHENYKAQSACAYHCAQMKKEGKDMKMK